MNAETFPSLEKITWPARATRAGVWLTAAGVLIVLVSGPANRFGIADFRTALLALGIGTLVTLVGGLATAIGLVAGARRGAFLPRRSAAAAVLAAVTVLAFMSYWMMQARTAPTLHEVSTDLEDPPPYVVLSSLRERTPNVNPSEYTPRIQGRSGPIDVPALQRRSYPDIQPLTLDVTPDEAWSRALRAVERLGWDIAAESAEELRIEATDTSGFFGFTDDIVVRVRAENGGARVDIRSKSRVGLSDLGANAARVREFLELMQHA